MSFLGLSSVDYATSSSFKSAATALYRDVVDPTTSGYKVQEDSTNGAYCYSEEDYPIVFYDNPRAKTLKSQYAKSNSFGGIIIWKIGTDDQVQTLPHAIDNTMYGPAGGIIERKTIPPMIDQLDLTVTITSDLKHALAAVMLYTFNGRLVLQSGQSKRTIHINRQPGIFRSVLSSGQTSPRR